MDMKAFADDSFNAKEWINRAYLNADKNEPKEIFISNTINALQLYVQQLDHSLEETTSQVISSLPRLVRETSLAESGAKTLRSRAEVLQEALESAQQAAGQPLLALQKTDRLKAKLEAARQTLREADKWADLTNKLEAMLEPGSSLDLPSVTQLLKDHNECLELLSDSPDHEDKRIQLEGLKNRLEAVLSPSVVEAFTSHQTDKCRQLWDTFTMMDRRAALGVYRARCEAGVLRSCLPSTLSGDTATAIRDLHTMLLRHAVKQLEWAPSACPGEATLPWLIRLQPPLLALAPPLPTSTESAPSILHTMADMLAACDHYVFEISSLINREQGKKGDVSENELKELGRAVYAQVKESLTHLGKLLVAAIQEDIGPASNIDENAETGTVFHMRTAKAESALKSRLQEGKKLSRGAVPDQLFFVAQWLIDELCSGWSKTSDLAACLSLFKAVSQITSLAEYAVDEIKEPFEDDVSGISKWPQVPTELKNWNDLLCPVQQMSTMSSAAVRKLKETPETLSVTLRKTAIKLVLEPISLHLNGVENLKCWYDNEQYVSELPDFSLSPQEYITQIGQYLLTLPQNLEPLLDRDDSSSDDDPAYEFLNEVCNSACEMFASKISCIAKLDSLGVRRCGTDIAYLTSILEELGVGTSGIQSLSDILTKRKAMLQ